jgi:uncharacterized protein (TIGR00730 family)
VKRVCVFAGSSAGNNEMHRRATVALAKALAARETELVYGGGCVGLMGVLADAMLEHGGRVIGVIPRSLMEREVGHRGVSELKVVESMHERKAEMASLADGFIALPGGFGTLDEMFEVLTWAQLGLHAHPCGVLNSDGYFDALFAFLDRAVAERFLRPEHRALWIADDDPDRLLARLAAHRPPALDKWLDRELRA